MSDSPKHKVVLDLTRTESDASWIDIFDKTLLTITPLWFNWIQWVLAYGAVLYFFNQDGGVGLAIVAGLSGGLLWAYFQALFFSIEFRGLPFIRTESRKRTVSLVLSGAFAIAAWLTASRVADAIAVMME